MLKRTVTAMVGLAILIPILCFSHTYAYVCLVAFLSVVSAYEILGCLGQRKNYPVSVPFYAVSLLIPLISRLFTDMYHFCAFAFGVLFTFMFYLFSLSVFTRGKYQIKDASTVFALGVYIIFAFTSLILLRDMEVIGKYVYLLPYVGAWTSDSFAYICGRLFGKHKLIPEVSPKKTVEGMIGGVAFSMLSFVVYGFAVSKIYGIDANYYVLLAVGAVVSLISQLGDLVASIIKRQYGIKDYGNILPGHGGIMDRFDSILAVSPFLFIILSIVIRFIAFFTV